MCHQSVGLIHCIIEKAGVPTASVTLLGEVTERVDPPRTLFVDLSFGYPLGAPNDAPLQTVIIMALLSLLKERVPPAVRWEFEAAG
jgi:D-proline reductase (dithiol) PrdB